MEMMIEVSSNTTKDRLKKLSLKTKNRRKKMRNFIFVEKDTKANENFNDLEKEVYSSIK